MCERMKIERNDLLRFPRIAFMSLVPVGLECPLP